MTATSYQDLSAEQIAEASRYLAATRDALVESTVRLSDRQFSFKPAPDRWSIAEIIEHMVIVEQRVHGIVGNMNAAAEPPEDWEPGKAEEVLLREVPNRSTRLQAPPILWPTQGWSRAEALEHFSSTREATLQLLSGSSLRGHVVVHPVLGPWDGYQWLLAAGAHGLRHTDQIQEVKSAADFPNA